MFINILRMLASIVLKTFLNTVVVLGVLLLFFICTTEPTRSINIRFIN